jgi:UDP-N-acetylmuramoyl-tripeptide--D-alanyl-D-alanine ligase
MKDLFKKVIVTLLLAEAWLVLKTRKPKIITVVGSVGKTSTKDAIYSALKDSLHVRKNQKSMNSEFGVPLTILDLQTGWNNPLIWVSNVILGFLSIFSLKKYPKYLVLEVGTDRPGDMQKTASWLRPDIVVVTSLPEVPVHVEHFDSPAMLREEDACCCT